VDRLTDPTLKVIRAKEHLDALEAAMFTFYLERPPAVVVEQSADGALNIIRARISPPPLRLGVLAGDAISSLREALDHLAWQLARLTQEPPFERTEFPIFPVQTDDAERRFGVVTQHVPQAAVEAMKLLQPYCRGEDYKSDPLWQIDKIWNVSKHQVIPANSHVLEFRGRGLGEFREFRQANVDEYIAVFARDPDASVEIHPEAVPTVTFGSSRHDVTLSFAQLRELHRYVAESVFPKFYGLLRSS